MDSLSKIRKQIKHDPANLEFTKHGIDPLYAVHSAARICLIGQALGILAQDSGIYFNDPSGDRLREWLGLSKKVFYDSEKIAVLPMDFYYPGKGKSGDLPPRKDFAKKWHPLLLEQMPNVELFVLIGSYAQKHYLQLPSSSNIGEQVRNYEKHLPTYFPIIHPSPRNNIWLKKNLWFERDVVPKLRALVSEIMND